jgi:peptidyl-prolyl cis-trans isomerase SurA
MTDRSHAGEPARSARRRVAGVAVALAAAVFASGATAQPRTADYIVAVVNQESVTAVEISQRLARVREGAARANATLPPPAQLRREVLDSLIDERVVLSFARDSGVRVDDAELERALASVALQNQIPPAQLRARVEREGLDYNRFRADIRDQLLVERVREREVARRIRIGDDDIDAFLAEQRAAAAGARQFNVAQILVPVPEGADAAVEAERRALAEAALARVRAGEDFAAVAREVSQDPNRERGGEIGLRPADRLPELFVGAVRDLRAGDVLPSLVRSGAGFHVLKLVERRDANAFVVTQTRARHILLRPSTPAGTSAAQRQLAEVRRAITTGTRRFDDVAREISEDASAPQGGDLGWTAPGSFVPEFEQAMNALPVGGVSEPVVSRFGVHLIQVLERRSVELDARQQRQLATNALRERKYEQAYRDWVRELRSQAYIELRDDAR